MTGAAAGTLEPSLIFFALTSGGFKQIYSCDYKNNGIFVLKTQIS